MKRTFLICIILLFGAVVDAQSVKSFEVLNPNVEQGGTIIIKIGSQWQVPGAGIESAISPGRIYSPDKNGFIKLGISSDTEPGFYRLAYTEHGIERPNSSNYIEVVEKKFPESFKGPVRIPSQTTQRRLDEDRKIKNNAYNSANLIEDFTLGKFAVPLDTIEITGEFGTRRIYGKLNRKTKNIKVEKVDYHDGVDLRARTPLNVMAVNSGRVLLAKHLLADGKIIVIDHGSGILSLYLHLSKFLVKEGDEVGVGSVIARTGATGATQGPHLHLMIKVNGIYVDPLKFIDTVNKYLTP